MAAPRIVVVGAGPAGTRAAEALVSSGIRPVVIDEAARSGGQIYRRQPPNFKRGYEKLYGFDAQKALGLHQCFDGFGDDIDYRPETSVWNVRDRKLYTVCRNRSGEVEFDAAIFATGATDRLAPVKGWTLPGCFSLGGSQIALKAQACSIGKRVAFFGTGPLLYLIAYQYAKAGVDVAAVIDTSPFANQAKAIPLLAARPSLLARGLYFRAFLASKRIPVHSGARSVEIVGSDRVRAVIVRTAGKTFEIETDAVGTGFHLRSENQLADLAGCSFLFDHLTQQWRPNIDQDGRTDRAGIYLAGDGARILGADAAETAGRLAAIGAMRDLGLPQSEDEIRRLRRQMQRFERFRKGLLVAFPWPEALAREATDDVLVCRCEAITVGSLRQTAVHEDALELNRAKAFSRVGMGRCQGRFCGSAAAEIVAAARDVNLADVGRIRGQAPIKPFPGGIDEEVAA